MTLKEKTFFMTPTKRNETRLKCQIVSLFVAQSGEKVKFLCDL